MTALEISEIKPFMAQFLGGTLFDHFLLSEATIHTFSAYHIDGRLLKDFYSSEELEAHGLTDLPCIPFSLVRETCFSMMKGRNVPLYFQFVFQLSPENMQRTLAQCDSSFTPSDISAMFINLTFKVGKLTATTGISYRIFSLDKSLEQAWDKLVEKFFRKHDIETTLL